MHISFTIQTGEKAPILPGQVSLAILMGKKKKKKDVQKYLTNDSNRRSKRCKSKIRKYTKAVVKS